MNRRNKKRPALQKEKVSIIAASVFVLSALTLAGVYMSSHGRADSEENRIDFAKMEQESAETQDTEQESTANNQKSVSGKVSDLAGTVPDTRFTRDYSDLSNNNDMDVDPAYTEVNSGDVSNTPIEGTDKAAVFMDENNTASEPAIENGTETVAKPEVNFGEGETLRLPIVGDILLNYSMDKAVYHSTMQQYRYNPALVVAATEGEIITAAANGIVTDIYYDAQTGNTISFDIGNGYELTYGQLDDINLSVGDMVNAGDMVGKVAKPTIYYTEEGTNIYYKLTKDGEPINPMDVANGSSDE